LTVRAVLLDLDDTLYDHAATSRRATAATLATEPALVAAGLDAVQEENVRQLEELHHAVATGHGWVDDARIERWRRILVRFGGPPARATELAMVYRANYHRNESAVDGAVELVHAPGLARALLRSSRTTPATTGRQARAPGSRASRFVVSVATRHREARPRLFEVGLARSGSRLPGRTWATRRTTSAARRGRTGGLVPPHRRAAEVPDVAVIRSLRPTEAVVRVLLDG
jgi:hypothetical protein